MRIAILELTPPFRVIKSKIIEENELNKSREEVISRNNLLYVAKLKGNLADLWELDKASLKAYKPTAESKTIPKSKEETAEETEDKAETKTPETNPLQCPYCNKVCSSKPGHTLHIKNKHPEKL